MGSYGGSTGNKRSPAQVRKRNKLWGPGKKNLEKGGLFLKGVNKQIFKPRGKRACGLEKRGP